MAFWIASSKIEPPGKDMGLWTSIISRFKGVAIDWEEMEETLVTSDLGIRLTTDLIAKLRARHGITDAATLVAACRDELKQILGDELPLPPPGPSGKPTVILVAGVNGVGKTTSVAKLASYLKGEGHSVVLAAADTFRAAAIEQLQIWGHRLEIPVVAGAYQSDPSAVCFNAHQQAIKDGAAYLICDTAGRLHTRAPLMDELKKIARTLAKQDDTAPHERWLVVDATTGSNALNQANEYHKALDLTGIIVTKLDGSGKGGSVLAIKHAIGVATRFIGTGESAKDFATFDTEQFLERLL